MQSAEAEVMSDRSHDAQLCYLLLREGKNVQYLQPSLVLTLLNLLSNDLSPFNPPTPHPTSDCCHGI